jgi:hypothetical protein
MGRRILRIDFETLREVLRIPGDVSIESVGFRVGIRRIDLVVNDPKASDKYEHGYEAGTSELPQIKLGDLREPI